MYTLSEAEEKTWITRIAINVCKNFRRTAWFQRTEPFDLIEIAGDIRDDYQQIDESIDLMQAILNLKEKYRAVLLLKYYEEFSVKEIADILSMKQSTVLSLLRRGRNQIRQYLKNDE